MLEAIEPITSPLTGLTDVTYVKSLSTEELIIQWQKRFNIDIRSEFGDISQIHLYRCNQTGLQFFVPLTVTGSSQLYEQLQSFDWYYMSDRWEHQVALVELTNCRQVLEFGCGAGSFVRQALKQGIDIQGIDINRTAVTIAQQQGLPIREMDLADAARKYPGQFDAVCSFQVLEHVPNPREILTWSLQLLKPHGKLIFCVPNAESFLKWEDSILDMPPHHMLRWSETSIKSLEKLFPVRLEKIAKEPLAPYHIDAYLFGYLSRFRKRHIVIRAMLNRWTVPLLAKIILTPIRNRLTGMSLYAQFRKLDTNVDLGGRS